MAETTYTYTIANVGTNNRIDSDTLVSEIKALISAPALERIGHNSQDASKFDVVFVGALSSAQKTTLDGDGTQTAATTPSTGSILGDHTGTKDRAPKPPTGSPRALYLESADGGIHEITVTNASALSSVKVR